ncbi:MAG TPA: polysaccharide deacetylase family protein [Gemmatimonadales bacterium]|nr:polysaccharide deacetylase family protein [Gemmatimonadales bacterium]
MAERSAPGFEKYTVTPRAFALQMRWLARAGYSAIGLDAVLTHRAHATELPRRPVVLTFDDGFRSCVERVVPVLQTYGFTAMFYLVAGLMGQTSRWLQATHGFELPLIDWPTARRLTDAGFHCGAHSMTHPHLPKLAPASCRYELAESRRLAEQEVGQEVVHLAYPFGSYDAAVRQMAAEAGFRSACSVKLGRSPPDDDPLALRRIPVTGTDTLLDFVCRLRTAQSLRGLVYRKARGAWRRIRAHAVR